MEESFKAVYMGFAAFVFVMGIIMLLMLQRSFDNTYVRIMEVVNGGFVW